MSSTSLSGLILAAGKGTRMKSELPKCLHSVCGLPMAEHLVRTLKALGVERPIVVVGHKGEMLQEALGERVEYAWQREQLGTGHAVLMAESELAGLNGELLIVPGDSPLLTVESLGRLVAHHRNSGAKATLATVRLQNPKGYGRIIRSNTGGVSRIVEEKDADEPTKAINEVGVSTYCFDVKELLAALPHLSNSNAQGEYYLTDVIARFVDERKTVEAVVFADDSEFAGVNDRWQLAGVETTLRLRIIREHAENGVSFLNPETTFVGPDVKIGVDTVIESGTTLRGDTTIGTNCRLGPHTTIDSCSIGNDCLIFMSYIRSSTVEALVKIGPYSHIRPDCVIGESSKIGNFVEIKNSQLAPRVAAGHLSYIGDATIATRSNIGAGVITCNYDGFSKHRSQIGEGVFVGANSTLVAPITIGDRAFVAAGSVIALDIPADAAGFGRARTEVKEEWALKWRLRRQK